ncbi:hypothetical protein [Bifidobacterium tissieri]|uniref:Uncharacterized protein n=1 Tax=Bifidobacterium tissieri TaxID=1630162 RepID=A0A5M9ZMF3_9BIFI|nr:hypothetical protein [Bifidobacterium tissieri]KAA8828655.1 hypothetical protein EM849_11500 [Bifidobacterium tissieri]KAA8831598.1 hypothetical protein EMO89_02415 [Bifidobacterium tissieri]
MKLTRWDVFMAAVSAVCLLSGVFTFLEALHLLCRDGHIPWPVLAAALSFFTASAVVEWLTEQDWQQ